MATRYALRLYDLSGSLLAIFPGRQFLSLAYDKESNAAGGVALLLDGTDVRKALFTENTRLEVWRADAARGITPYRDAEYLVAGWRDYVQDRRQLIEIWGPGLLDMLARRVIDGAAGGAGASKTAAAETVAKQLVDEQIVSATVAGRRITGLSIEADAASGGTITLNCAYANLLEAVQKAATLGNADIDVVSTSTTAWQFQWSLSGSGTKDKRSTVRFALNFNNMDAPSYSVDRQGVLTHVLVGGQGEGSDRQTVWCDDGSGISGIARREAFADARNEPTIAGLNAKGEALIDANRWKSTLSFTVRQSGPVLYGRDYSLNDWVRGKYESYEADKKITSVHVEVSREGSEVISVGMTDV